MQVFPMMQLDGSAGVVSVPVREEQQLDRREMEVQSVGVGEPCIGARADSEKHRSSLIAPPASDEDGQTMASDAQVIEQR